MATTTDAGRRRMPLLLWAATLAAMLVGSLCLVPTVSLYYANINPSKPRPGDLYMGDGTGFVLGTFFAVPALLSLATAALVPCGGVGAGGIGRSPWRSSPLCCASGSA